MLARAIVLAWDDLASHCRSAIEAEPSVRELRRMWRAQRDRRGRAPTDPMLRTLDNQIDQTLGGIVRDLRNKARSLAGTPTGALAETFLQEVFPTGAIDITSASWVEQTTEVADLLTVLNGERRSAVEALGLMDYVSQLASLNADFSQRLSQGPSQPLQYDQLRKAEAEAQERLLQAVAMILGRFWGQSDEHVTQRIALLKVLTEQNATVSALISARRKVTDIDPGSGAPLGEDDPAAPAPTDTGAPNSP